MHDTNVFDGLYKSPVGWLGIRLQGNSLIELDWLEEGIPYRKLRSRNIVIKKITASLDAYFKTTSPPVIPPLSLTGTRFQQRVWRALQKIPFGTVKTYGELATELNTSSRAIGQACSTNPITILIPCHRVVAANGIGGYMGDARPSHIKQWLLHHEGIH